MTSCFLFSFLFLSTALLCFATTELDLCVKSCHEKTNPRSQDKCRRSCRTEIESRQREEVTNPRAREREEEEEMETETDVPYHFNTSYFRRWFKSPDGYFGVMPQFSDRAWPLHRSIENYRFAFLETQPNTILVPHHVDADVVFIVIRGSGIVTFVNEQNTESFNIEYGHVVTVPAGTTIYLMNGDENERLQLAKLYQATSTPGQFQEYFLAGASNQESYFSAFSSEVRQASLNTPKEELERLFGGEKHQGVIRKASPEQIRALSQHAMSAGKRRGHGSRPAPIDLRGLGPVYSNEHGQFFEARPEDFPQLQDMDVHVSFTNMTEGSIFVPHFNSKATTMVFLVEGTARFEMACPHVTSAEVGHVGRIQKITTNAVEGEIFIIPPGHPVAIVATRELRAVAFGINARNNKRNFIGGQVNIMRKVEKEVKEVIFEVEGELADRVFGSNPQESFFVSSRHHEQRHHSF